MVFARGSSNVVFAAADRPNPASAGFMRVIPGTANPVTRDIVWAETPDPIRVSGGYFANHRVIDLCLTGDGGERFWFGVLLSGTTLSGPGMGTTSSIVRLYRSQNGGRRFERVQLTTNGFPVERYDHDQPASVLACALLPGDTEVLLGTLSSGPNGLAAHQLIRVPVSGEVAVVQTGEPRDSAFAVAPQILPFAMVANGPP